MSLVIDEVISLSTHGDSNSRRMIFTTKSHSIYAVHSADIQIILLLLHICVQLWQFFFFVHIESYYQL
jgi:hypothetical protein